MRALVVTWGPGGNLPPMLGAADVLRRRGHEVTVLASGETAADAAASGAPVVRYRRAPDLDVRVAFEAQAERVMAIAAGAEVALDVRDAIDDVRPDLVVADCMLPAALAAAEATRTPAASVVHFLYGVARRAMIGGGGAWTTDLAALAVTRRRLGLPPLGDGIAAWESPDLVLVTAPRWLDADAGAPEHVVHAGPLAVATAAEHPGPRDRVLLSFSTTVMEGQPALVERACSAVADLGVPATLTLGPGVASETLRVPDAVEVVAFADHDRLMPACAAVVCHGGLGTVLRALAHGVPLLVLPLGRDQGVNARQVEALGAGIALEAGGAPPARIRDGVRALLDDPAYHARAEAAAERIAAEDPDATAAAALEHAAGVRR